MAAEIAAMLYDGEERILLVRPDDEGAWTLPRGGVEPGEDPWDAAVRILRRQGFEGLALRKVAEENGTQYWRMAGRSGSYESPGRFFDADDLPELADQTEAAPIQDGRRR